MIRLARIKSGCVPTCCVLLLSSLQKLCQTSSRLFSEQSELLTLPTLCVCAADSADSLPPRWQADARAMSQIPALIWAQRREKVFVTFECIGTEEVNVTFADGLLSLDAKAKGKVYKLENLPLWTEIDVEESKWFKNDRCADASGRRIHTAHCC